MRAILILPVLFGSIGVASAGAVCADGHFSSARHHGGACSHHGGVSGWRPSAEYERDGHWSDDYFGGGPYYPGTTFYGEIGTVHYGY